MHGCMAWHMTDGLGMGTVVLCVWHSQAGPCRPAVTTQDTVVRMVLSCAMWPLNGGHTTRQLQLLHGRGANESTCSLAAIPICYRNVKRDTARAQTCYMCPSAGLICVRQVRSGAAGTLPNQSQVHCCVT